MNQPRYPMNQVCDLLGVNEEFILLCVRSRWIVPAAREPLVLDEEDLARLRLIMDLRSTFEVNDPSIAVILHLLDQVYALRNRIRNAA